MEGAKKIVVIGSGPGGSGVAAVLAARGHEVDLLERNPFPGGKCASFEKDGYIVDTGVHMFSMGPYGPHGDVARMAGGEAEWVARNPAVDIINCDHVLWRVYQNMLGPRGICWLGSSLARGMFAQRKSARGASDGRKLLDRETYRATKKYGPLEALRTLARIVRLDPGLVDELDDVTLQEFAHGLWDENAFLQELAHICMVLMVVPYDRASAGEFLVCFGQMLQKQALSVPKGGSREVTGSFIRGLRKSGGVLKLGREVTRIVVENGRATGVECADGESFTSDVVISNAGIKRTVELAGEENFPGEYVEYVKGLEYSYSFITTKFGLDRRVIEAVAPCISVTPYVHPDHMFDYIDEGTAPVDPMLYMPIPTEWDEYAAPPGKQLVIMGVPGPIEATPENIEQCEKILERGEERLFELFPRLPRHIEWKMRNHVGHTAALTGKPTGECIGLAQCVGQTGRHKPSPKTPVEGLWLVGADAGGRGVGTEQASASAIYVAGLVD